MSPRGHTLDELVVAQALAARAHAARLVDAVEDAFAHAAQSNLTALLPEHVRRAPHGETACVVGVALARHYRYASADAARRQVAWFLRHVHPDVPPEFARRVVEIVRLERATDPEHREDGGDLPDEEPPTVPDAAVERARSDRPSRGTP